MEKYRETVTDTEGNIIPIATITVYDKGTSNLSTIYSDDGITEESNPFNTGSDAVIRFWAGDGKYDIQIVKSGYATINILDVQLLDGTTGASGGVENDNSTTIGADGTGDANGDINFQINSVTKGQFKNNGDFVLDTDGFYFDISTRNIGIGTDVPGEKLDVDGNIQSNRFMFGDTNVKVGDDALLAVTSGTVNVAVGFDAMKVNTDGNSNVAVGSTAMSANISGSFNVAFGRNALASSETGANNTALGYLSLYACTASHNTAVGYEALRGLTSGASNVGVGYAAGKLITAGGNNETSGTSVYIGQNTRASADGNTNEVAIGYNTYGNGSNTVTLGNVSITDTILRGNIGIGVTAFGTSAANVLGITADGTVPSTSPAGMIQIFADDSSAGATNATLAIRTEEAVASEVLACDTTLNIWVNGVEYHLLMRAV